MLYPLLLESPRLKFGEEFDEDLSLYGDEEAEYEEGVFEEDDEVDEVDDEDREALVVVSKLVVVVKP